MKYDHADASLQGSSAHALLKGRGHCSDYHGLCAAVGRALGDGRRVRILRRLVEGNSTLDELAEAVGLARSTTHHHLTQLRAAGLVTLGGNARGYWYALRPEGLTEAQRAIGGLALPPAS